MLAVGGRRVAAIELIAKPIGVGASPGPGRAEKLPSLLWIGSTRLRDGKPIRALCAALLWSGPSVPGQTAIPLYRVKVAIQLPSRLDFPIRQGSTDLFTGVVQSRLGQVLPDPLQSASCVVPNVPVSYAAIWVMP